MKSNTFFKKVCGDQERGGNDRSAEAPNSNEIGPLGRDAGPSHPPHDRKLKNLTKIALATPGKTGVILLEKMFMEVYFLYEIKLNWANPPKGGDAKPDGSNAALPKENTL